MIEAANVLSYPSRTFMREARAALAGGVDVVIKIRPGWRVRLLGKTLEYWPKRTNDFARLKSANRLYFGISTYLLFSFFHTHTYALTLGRTMNYTNADDGLTVIYTSTSH